MNCSRLIQNSDKRRAFVKKVMNLRVALNSWNYLNSLNNANFLSRILRRGVSWLVSQSLGWLVSWLVSQSFGCLVVSLLGCLISQSLGWLVSWFVSWLFNQSVTWLVS